jgi:hypothetical protein
MSGRLIVGTADIEEAKKGMRAGVLGDHIKKANPKGTLMDYGPFQVRRCFDLYLIG